MSVAQLNIRQRQLAHRASGSIYISITLAPFAQGEELLRVYLKTKEKNKLASFYTAFKNKIQQRRKLLFKSIKNSWAPLSLLATLKQELRGDAVEEKKSEQDRFAVVWFIQDPDSPLTQFKPIYKT